MEKTTPSFFPRDENILSPKLKIFCNHIGREILRTWLLSLSSASAALRAIAHAADSPFCTL